MTLFDYLKSKVFLRMLIVTLVTVTILVVLFLNLLGWLTNHGQEITVPDLSGKTIVEVENSLDNFDLEYIVLDTLDYDKSFPKFGVVIQNPSAGSKVKAGRKIYIKLNADGYAYVTLPNLIETTIRQAEPTLKVLGLEIGEITYKPYLGKDMVMEVRQNGKLLKSGDRVMKTSKIDLVLGDGKIGFEEEIEDTDNEIIDVREDE